MARRSVREGSMVVAESMMPRLFGPHAPEELRSRWLRIMASTKPEGIAAALRAMAVRPDSFSTLASMTCPVLNVAGEDDRLTPPEDAKRMQQAAPISSIEVLQGAGHMSPVERPNAFLEVLTRFLAGLPRRDRR